MCLILFGYDPGAECKLIVAANRDEVHSRASAPADFWDDHPELLAGRDLVAGGTWLGCTRQGRFAALTNFSNPTDPPAAHSRGQLVHRFLASSIDAHSYAHAIHGADYAGFNLLLWDGAELVYTSNRGPTDVLKPGFYGLSNAELGAQWPKCIVGASRLQTITQMEYQDDMLLDLLRDQLTPPDEQLPHRGRSVANERRVAPCFIVGDEYGTRASTIVAIRETSLSFTEQSYAAAGKSNGRMSYNVPFPDASTDAGASPNSH
jgi:uncharacterized protein with NRDE domain